MVDIMASKDPILVLKQKFGHMPSTKISFSSVIKWVDAFPLPDYMATAIAYYLPTEVFLGFGVSWFLLSEQSLDFILVCMAEHSQLLKIHRARTYPYHPQSVDLVERLN